MEFDIVIIGGGCVGASILAEASRRGLSHMAVVDFGQRTESATAHSGGLVRVFHESLQHIELALGARTLTSRYQEQGVLPSRARSLSGGLYVFHRDRLASYQAGFQKMHEAEWPFEVLASHQLQRRFPEFVWTENDMAVFEPLATRENPITFVESLLKESLRRGARVFENFEVQRVCPYLDRYRLSGPHGAITAKSVVLAGGARLLPRLADFGVQLDLEARRLTSFLRSEIGGDENLPTLFDRETLKFANFEKDHRAIFSDIEFPRLRRQLRAEDFEPFSALDCYSEGRAGLLGRVPGHSGLFVATGWGGTAYKFSLEIGRRMAMQLEKEYFERRLQHGAQ